MKKQIRPAFNQKLFFAAIPLALIAAISFYLNRETPAGVIKEYKHYPDFGIEIPVKYSLHGIDVSRYQKEIFWDDVKQMKIKNIGISFAFIKATEGIDRKDEQLERNMTEAKNAGVIRGAYHFFTVPQNGKEQAENFMSAVELSAGDLPPVLDAEQANGASVKDVQDQIAEWLNAVQERYNTKPIIYSNIDFYKNYLAGRFDNYPLWIAHYYEKEKPRINRHWSFWQHNEKGTVNGINTLVDFNVFNGDSSALQQLLLK